MEILDLFRQVYATNVSLTAKLYMYGVLINIFLVRMYVESNSIFSSKSFSSIFKMSCVFINKF